MLSTLLSMLWPPAGWVVIHRSSLLHLAADHGVPGFSECFGVRGATRPHLCRGGTPREVRTPSFCSRKLTPGNLALSAPPAKLLSPFAMRGRGQTAVHSCHVRRYCVVFDPLDGSSNIDCGVSIGTVSGGLAQPSAAGMPEALASWLPLATWLKTELKAWSQSLIPFQEPHNSVSLAKGCL